MVGVAAALYILALAIAVLCVAVALAGVWAAVRGRPTAGRQELPGEVRELLRATRRRVLVAVGSALVVFAGICASGLALPGLLGLPLALAPSLSAAAALWLYSAAPPRSVPVGGQQRREASLVRRGPSAHVSVPTWSVLGLLVSAQVALVVFAGVTSTPDGQGRHRMIGFRVEEFASSSGPYPGWFYGVPLVVATAVLAAAATTAFWRVSTTPVIPGAALATLDRRWRTVSTRVLAAVAASALLLQLGGTGVVAGNAIRMAHLGPAVPTAWSVTSWVFVLGGLVLVVASVVALLVGARWALGLLDAVQQQPPGSAAREAAARGAGS